MTEVPDDKKIFSELYARESDAIFRYCFLRVHDRERALDITADIFTEVWKEYCKGTEIRHERAYLFTLARNRIIDWYRKKKSISLDALLDPEEGESPFDPVDFDAQAKIIISTEGREALAAIEKLETSYRDVLYLRFVEDLSPQEIAEILGGTANNISVRITRGLEKLKEKLHIEK